MADVRGRLATVGLAHDVSVSLRQSMLSGGSITMTIQMTSIDPMAGQVPADDVAELATRAHVYGLSPSDLGREFVAHGVTHRIVGIRNGARQCPVLAQDGDGQVYRFDHLDVKQWLRDAQPRRVRP
ncbi:MAG: hypothetical protein RLZZ598_1835 [Pseudomonadota bacterium]|jgi:hypothetical protein